MGLHHLTVLLPLVGLLAHARAVDTTTKNMPSGTNFVRNLQAGLFDDGATATSANTTDPTISAPIYTPEQCNSWIGTLGSADSDASNGVSASEYHVFLSSIEYPPYISEYFKTFQGFDQMPWVFRVVHKSLACHCEKLGMGEQCCEGDDAEVLLLGLDDSNGDSTGNGAEDVYRDLFCQQIAYVLTNSVPSPSPTDGPTASPTESPSAGPTTSPSPAPSRAPSKPQTSAPSLAPVTPNPTTSPVERLTATSKPTIAPSVSHVPTVLIVPQIKILSTETEGDEEKGSALGIGGIIGIILAVLVLLIAVLALLAHRRRAEEEEQLRKFAGDQASDHDDLEAPPTAADEEPEQEAAPRSAPDVAGPGAEPDEDDESSAPSVWSESSDGEDTMDELQDDGDEPTATAGSALAAMGAASTVAARIGATGSSSE